MAGRIEFLLILSLELETLKVPISQLSSSSLRSPRGRPCNYRTLLGRAGRVIGN